MYIYYKDEIVNTNLVFDMKISNKVNESSTIRFFGPAEGRYMEFIFRDEKTAIFVLNRIYNGLDNGWECIDVQKEILDKL